MEDTKPSGPAEQVSGHPVDPVGLSPVPLGLREAVAVAHSETPFVPKARVFVALNLSTPWNVVSGLENWAGLLWSEAREQSFPFSHSGAFVSQTVEGGGPLVFLGAFLGFLPESTLLAESETNPGEGSERVAIHPRRV